MFKKEMTFVLPAVAVMGLAPFARADFDFSPRIEIGAIVTGGHDDEQGIDVSSLRVGAYGFGEGPLDPYNTGDPGFNTIGASSFAASSQLRLEALGTLQYWDGTGSPSFNAAPAGASLELMGSPARFVTFTNSAVTYTPTSPASLLIGSFATNGALHVHLTSSIFENNSQEIDSVPEGEYLIAFDLQNPGTGVANSQPLYIVYDNGPGADVQSTAVNYVQTTYVPEPAGLSMIGASMLLLHRKRT